MELYRPLVKKIGQVFDGHILDLYCPSFWDKKRRKRIYFGDKGKIVRFKTYEEASEYLRQQARKHLGG